MSFDCFASFFTCAIWNFFFLLVLCEISCAMCKCTLFCNMKKPVFFAFRSECLEEYCTFSFSPHLAKRPFLGTGGGHVSQNAHVFIWDFLEATNWKCMHSLRNIHFFYNLICNWPCQGAQQLEWLAFTGWLHVFITVSSVVQHIVCSRVYSVHLHIRLF